ncbi:HK97-gp10 family putative phage morphogenesis protein [Hahella sp. HN01]|uniref:HK97-gp10 family putative phage morphogenesis protein n=1 Tax=Hahella sp. HN01 TaxID=2847262 RepID=UPI001C1EC427|nr:HK97-gp10 family putative phage morphogenesis protein [Hahella sp. HN01]
MGADVRGHGGGGMSSGVKISGLRELHQALQQLGKQAANKAARDGLTEAAKTFRKEIRQGAPVKSGHLRKHIRYKLRRDRSGRGYTGRVGVHPKAYYARFIEFGAAPHAIPNPTTGRGRNKRKNKKRLRIGSQVVSGVNHPGIAPRPFLRPAFLRAKDAAVKAAGKRMWRSIIQARARR